MVKYLFLYWGTILLMYLSQVYSGNAHDTGYGLHQSGLSHFMRQKSDFFVITIIAWMTCFSFLRTGFNDTYAYRINFIKSETLVEGFANGTFTDWAENPLSSFYRCLMRTFTDDYHIYFLFPALMSAMVTVKLCQRYSVSPGFSLLVFYSIGQYTMNLAALKQSMAIVVLICALPYAIEKKYVRFFLLVLIATLFHTYAALFAIIPFFMSKPWSKTTWIALVIAVVAMMTYEDTLGSIMGYAGDAGVNMHESELFDGHALSLPRVIVFWVPGLIALIFRKQLFRDSTRTENLFVNLSILGAMVLMLGLVQGANLYGRMTAYFSIGTIIALPWMLHKVFNKRSENLVMICAGAFYFAYFIYENVIDGYFDQDYHAISLWQYISSIFQ